MRWSRGMGRQALALAALSFGGRAGTRCGVDRGIVGDGPFSAQSSAPRAGQHAASRGTPEVHGPSAVAGERRLKRSPINLGHQLKAERVQQLSETLHFAKICDSVFLRNALKKPDQNGRALMSIRRANLRYVLVIDLFFVLTDAATTHQQAVERVHIGLGRG